VKRLILTAVAAVACSILSYAQFARQASPPDLQAAAAAEAANRDPRDGLSDLDAMTFACPKAALNAAAREAKTVPSKGTYQFSYFKIINYSHHSSYEIHFKSNHQEEADLKYCVAMYCQQGWDPRTTQISVTLMGSERQSKAGGAHVSNCSHKQRLVKNGSK
jgi:hypothetical protein